MEHCCTNGSRSIPSDYLSQVSQSAHEIVLSEHLGRTKTFHCVSKLLFWLDLKSSVSEFVRSCPTCQLADNPHQTVLLAPLNLMPGLGEPFEQLIIDYVGSLPKSKSGHQYVLTIVCLLFYVLLPEAVPLSALKARTVVQELLFYIWLTKGDPVRSRH